MKRRLWGHLIPCLPWKKKYFKQFIISLGHEKRFLKPKSCNTTGCSLPGCQPDPVPRVPFPRSWSHFQQQLQVPLLIPHIPPALPPPSPCNHLCFYLTQIPISKWEPRASKGRIPTRAVSGVTQSTAPAAQILAVEKPAKNWDRTIRGVWNWASMKEKFTLDTRKLLCWFKACQQEQGEFVPKMHCGQ